jgi:hypothetical protein
MKRIFVCDLKESQGKKMQELDRDFLKREAEEIGLEIVVETTLGDLKTIPKNYDAYLFHMSDIDIEKVGELRRDNPLAWIYGLARAGDINYRAYKDQSREEERVRVKELKKYLRIIFDNIFSTFLYDEPRAMIEQIQNYRKPSEPSREGEEE